MQKCIIWHSRFELRSRNSNEMAHQWTTKPIIFQQFFSAFLITKQLNVGLQSLLYDLLLRFGCTSAEYIFKPNTEREFLVCYQLFFSSLSCSQLSLDFKLRQNSFQHCCSFVCNDQAWKCRTLSLQCNKWCWLPSFDKSQFSCKL